MTRYNIKIKPEYSWADFIGWQWQVYVDGRIAARHTAAWKWLAKYRAEKWVRNHAKGLIDTPIKAVALDYDYDPWV